MRFGRLSSSFQAVWIALLGGAAMLYSLGPLGVGDAHASQVDIGQLERELMNPCENCGGKPLAGSYCGGASSAKKELREMADSGMTHDEIVDAFVARYGEWILAVPERTGFNLFAWILPVAGMVVGGGGLALFLRRTNESRRQSQSVDSGSTASNGQSDDSTHPAAPSSEARSRGPADLDELRSRLEREVRED